MRYPLYHKIIIFILLSVCAIEASEVVEVTQNQKRALVTQGKRREWQESDPVCLTRKGDKIACGTVVSVKGDNALIEVETADKEIQKGDRVFLKGRENDDEVEEELTQEELEEETQENLRKEDYKSIVSRYFDVKDEEVEDRNMSLGIGTNILNPFLNFQFTSRASQCAIGVMILYQNFTVSKVKSVLSAIMLNLDYYTEKPFSGFFVQSGLGWGSSKTTYLTTSSQQNVFTVLGSIGWRWQWHRASVALSGGAQYFELKKSTSLTYNFYIVLPFASFEIGLVF